MPKDLPWFPPSWLEGRSLPGCGKDLPITDWEFYQQLKQVGVIVVPGTFPWFKEELAS